MVTEVGRSRASLLCLCHEAGVWEMGLGRAVASSGARGSSHQSAAPVLASKPPGSARSSTVLNGEGCNL